MDVENLAKELILKNMTPEQQMAVLDSVRSSVVQAKEVQKRKIGENVDLVVQALKKIESDIRSRFDDVGNAIEKRVSTIKDGRDGINGKDGRDGKDGRNGKDGTKGDRGERGQDGVDGINGVDGVSVTNANIDFDGSLIITLSSGIQLNVGEVVAPDLVERIKVITNGGGTAQFVLDTLTSLQTQITNLIPSQTGNSGKYLTTNGTALSWGTIAGSLSYLGTWNASTNTPTLTSSVGTNGIYYIVATAGSTNLNGITDWQIGDWLLFNGSVWQKIDQSNLVTSVNGYTGTVVLTQTDVSGTASLTTTQTLTNKTLTSPIINEILDANGNEILGLSTTASATDFLTVKNGIGVGVPLHIYADGSSSNIGLHIQPKGTGLVTISDGTDFNKGIRFRSSSSSASAVTLIDAVSTAGRVVTLPDATDTLVGRNTTDTLTNKTLTSPTLTSPVLGTPASGDLTNCTFPTLNQNTTGSAATLTTGRTIAVTGDLAYTSPSFDGSANVTAAGTLATVNTNVGSFTNASVTVNGKGLVTAVSSGTAPVTSVTGTSPVSSSGGATPAISLAASYGDTQNPYASKTANYVLAAPDGSSGVPTFRAIVAADIPTLNQNTTGSAATVTTTINSGVVATTQSAGDNSTKVATTAYVNAVTGTGGITGFKNRIINGAMVIDKRNDGTEVNPAVNSRYYLDRWEVLSTAASKFKIGQNAGAVTPPAGYSKYLGCTSLSAYTVGASETFAVRQTIEGLNIADLAWGTASAATVTLSFWVRSSLTGTFGGVLKNSAGDRSYPFSYTISASNTWEQKTVTIAGDTTGTWLTTNGVGIIVVLSIGAGATVSGTAGAWAGANYNSATGAVSVVGTSGATFYITGVQLEKGSTATSFDYRPYGTELALCQRYYESTDTTARDAYGSGYFATSTSVTSFWRWSVEKRAIPSLTASSTAAGVVTVNYGSASAQNSAVSSITFSLISSKSSRVDFTVASAVTAGTSALVSSRGDNGYYLSADAEL